MVLRSGHEAQKIRRPVAALALYAAYRNSVQITNWEDRRPGWEVMGQQEGQFCPRTVEDLTTRFVATA